MSEGAAERRTEVCGKVQWLNGRQGDPVSVQAQAGARSRLVEGDNIRTAAIGGVRRLVEHSAVSGLAAILAPGRRDRVRTLAGHSCKLSGGLSAPRLRSLEAAGHTGLQTAKLRDILVGQIGHAYDRGARGAIPQADADRDERRGFGMG